MVAESQELHDRIKDKNDLLETKEIKNNEVLNQIDQQNTLIDLAANRIEIQKDFKEGLSLLDDKERQLEGELIKLKKLGLDYKKWKDESGEKLEIQ